MKLGGKILKPVAKTKSSKKLLCLNLRLLGLTSTFLLGSFIAPIAVKKAEADHCSKTDFTCPPEHRTGPIIKVDPVFDVVKCQSWWNCDPNQIQINQAVIAAKRTGLIKNREECKNYVRQVIGKANEELQGLPGLDFFLRRGTNQGNDSCNLQFTGVIDPPPNTSKILVMTTPNGITKCLDAAAETILNERGTLQLYRCNGSGNQQWTISSGRLMMTTPNGITKCVDAAAETILNERGTLQLYRCNGSGNQQWTISSGRLMMTTPNGITKCVDAAAETILNERGTLQLYRCNGSGNQQWNFR